MDKKIRVISTALLMCVIASLLIPIVTAGPELTITSPINGELTGIEVYVEGTFTGNIPHPDEGYWLLTNPMDSNGVWPGAPIEFTFDGKWNGTWRGKHAIYLTGDPNQLQQPFRIIVAKVNPPTHDLYVYRLENEIYGYIGMQPGTHVLVDIVVERLK